MSWETRRDGASHWLLCQVAEGSGEGLEKGRDHRSAAPGAIVVPELRHVEVMWHHHLRRSRDSRAAWQHQVTWASTD